MKNLCGNDKKDGLETVLEVPIPEEICTAVYVKDNSWHNMKNWMKSQLEKAAMPIFGCRRNDLQLLLGVIGAPLVPIPLIHEPLLHLSIKNNPIETSSAQYIVQQYIAATGGCKVLNSIKNLYAMGNVRMVASEFETANKVVRTRNPSKGGEVGCFVLWQMTPVKWCMELVVGGVKLCAGSDGKLVWRQTPWLGSHASRGPARPLRRSLQGLDPRTTASLFSNARCVGEKNIGEEACFVLKLSAETSTLNARSSGSVEIIRHTVMGYFSQKTGFLVQLEDSHLLRIQAIGEDAVFWETKMESRIDEYRDVDGVNIAHAGRSVLTLFRFGETANSHTRTRMEETWTIKEVAFNVQGLSTDCFLPPADLKEKALSEACDLIGEDRSRSTLPNGRSKVAAIDKAMETFDE
eukprot:Gb_31528 [translate_table: standard]